MKVRIATFEENIAEIEAKALRVEGEKGNMGVLNNHAPLVGLLKKGEIVCDTTEGRRIFLASDGYLKIENNTIDIILKWCRRDGNAKN